MYTITREYTGKIKLRFPYGKMDHHVEYAVCSLDFLIPLGKTILITEWLQLCAAYYDNPRVNFLISHIKNIIGE